MKILTSIFLAVQTYSLARKVNLIIYFFGTINYVTQNNMCPLSVAFSLILIGKRLIFV